ncbi:MAG: hypothetical protein M0005_04395 [Actinomycetota bacterium]|jgi:hypothetical protein|nr:hypothetical protein [Actinomycetota bacterium]
MDSTERQVAELLRRQYGVVAKDQLARVGMTRDQIHHRCRAGEWAVALRRVYRSAVFPETFEQRLMVAMLAAGAGAVVSHGSAAWLWQLQARPPDRPSLTVPARRHPQIPGADLYRHNDLDYLRVSHRRNFDCTDPLRTLVDFAAVATTHQLADAVDTALSTRLVTVGGLEAELSRRAGRGRRGVRPLRDLLTRRGMIGAPTPSALEAETSELLHLWKIPVLGREVHIGPDGRYRVDFSLPPPVVIEVDGFAYHWSPEAKAYDEARRNRLRLEGTFVLVYTWRDIRFDGRRVALEALAALGRFACGAVVKVTGHTEPLVPG